MHRLESEVILRGERQQHQALSALVNTATAPGVPIPLLQKHTSLADTLYTRLEYSLSAHAGKCALLSWHGKSKLVFSCLGVAVFLPDPFVPGVFQGKITEVLPQSAALERRICKRGQQSCPHPASRITSKTSFPIDRHTIKFLHEEIFNQSSSHPVHAMSQH